MPRKKKDVTAAEPPDAAQPKLKPPPMDKVLQVLLDGVEEAEGDLLEKVKEIKTAMWDRAANPEGVGVDMETYDMLQVWSVKLKVHRRTFTRLKIAAETAPWREGAPRQMRLGEFTSIEASAEPKPKSREKPEAQMPEGDAERYPRASEAPPAVPMDETAPQTGPSRDSRATFDTPEGSGPSRAAVEELPFTGDTDDVLLEETELAEAVLASAGEMADLATEDLRRPISEATGLLFCERCDVPTAALSDGLCPACVSQGWRREEGTGMFVLRPHFAVPTS
jgi:hypothetical protein